VRVLQSARATTSHWMRGTHQPVRDSISRLEQRLPPRPIVTVV
jgi:hypothetical protein